MNKEYKHALDICAEVNGRLIEACNKPIMEIINEMKERGEHHADIMFGVIAFCAVVAASFVDKEHQRISHSEVLPAIESHFSANLRGALDQAHQKPN